jgi:hypothetical protein
MDNQLDEIIEKHINSSNKHEVVNGWITVPVILDCSKIDQDKREDLINEMSEYILEHPRLSWSSCISNEKVKIVGDRFILDFSYVDI